MQRQGNLSSGLCAGERSKDHTADILYNNYSPDLAEGDTLSRTTYYNETLHICLSNSLISSLDYAHTFIGKLKPANSFATWTSQVAKRARLFLRRKDHRHR